MTPDGQLAVQPEAVLTPPLPTSHGVARSETTVIQSYGRGSTPPHRRLAVATRAPDRPTAPGRPVRVRYRDATSVGGPLAAGVSRVEPPGA